MKPNRKKTDENNALQNYIASQLDNALSHDQLNLLKRNAAALRKVILQMVAQSMLDWSRMEDPGARQRIWDYQNALQDLEITLSYFKED